MLSLSKLPEREVESPRKLSRWLDTVMGDEDDGGFLVKDKGSSRYLPLPIELDGKFDFFRRSRLKVWRRRREQKNSQFIIYKMH